jgi:dihydroxy-acid dehydratase
MAKKPKTLTPRGKNLRSQLWFDNPANPGMTALYLERYLNYGLTGRELRSGKPIVGIAQTGSDLSPCNRHHLELAKRVREGIRDAGGVAFEFPCHPIQETGKRPTAALDRNLAYLSLVEVLYGYPLDGVVLMTGCDKTTPACVMAAATVNIPAIVLSGGPMLNGWWRVCVRVPALQSGRRARNWRRAVSTTRSFSISPARRRRRSATATPWAPRRR